MKQTRNAMTHAQHMSAPSSKLMTIGASTLAVAMLLTAFPAHAYVGPGAGLSLLSALWAVLAAILVAVGFVLMWPIRKMMRKRKANRTTAQSSTTESSKHSSS
tara:strand:- start:392 stop:700 length:309 start_codon:yes stop_codon:yes gene_type:complete